MQRPGQTYRLKWAIDSPGMMRKSAFPVPAPVPFFCLSPLSPSASFFNLLRDGASAWPSPAPFLFRSDHSCWTFAAFSTRATLFGMPSSSIPLRAPGARLAPLRRTNTDQFLPHARPRASDSLHTIQTDSFRAPSVSHACEAFGVDVCGGK